MSNTLSPTWRQLGPQCHSQLILSDNLSPEICTGGVTVVTVQLISLLGALSASQQNHLLVLYFMIHQLMREKTPPQRLRKALMHTPTYTQTFTMGVHRLTQLNTRYAYHILPLFNILSCNWNALGPAFLQSSDSVVEKLSLFIFQPAICRADNVSHSKLSFCMGDLDPI